MNSKIYSIQKEEEFDCLLENKYRRLFSTCRFLQIFLTYRNYRYYWNWFFLISIYRANITSQEYVRNWSNIDEKR